MPRVTSVYADPMDEHEILCLCTKGCLNHWTACGLAALTEIKAFRPAGLQQSKGSVLDRKTETQA
jgi:hypothetical protein